MNYWVKCEGVPFICALSSFMYLYLVPAIWHTPFQASLSALLFQFIIILYEYVHTLDYDDPGNRRFALFCFTLLFFILLLVVHFTILCIIVSYSFSFTM